MRTRVSPWLRRVAHLTLAGVAMIVTSGVVEAQFGFDNMASLTNPQIPVEMEHPPAIALAIERVAFAPATGPCSDEFMTNGHGRSDGLLRPGVPQVDVQVGSTDGGPGNLD